MLQQTAVKIVKLIAVIRHDIAIFNTKQGITSLTSPAFYSIMTTVVIMFIFFFFIPINKNQLLFVSLAKARKRLSRERRVLVLPLVTVVAVSFRRAL